MKFPPRTERESEYEPLSWKILVSIEQKSLPKCNRKWKKEVQGELVRESAEAEG